MKTRTKIVIAFVAFVIFLFARAFFFDLDHYKAGLLGKPPVEKIQE